LPELNNGSQYNLYNQDYIGLSSQNDGRNGFAVTTTGHSKNNKNGSQDKTFSDKHLTEQNLRNSFNLSMSMYNSQLDKTMQQQ